MTPELTATALVVLALAVLLYGLSCWVWPFGRCWACSGRGSHSPRGNARISRPCWWCKGAGRRLRIGRRIANAIRDRRA